MIIMFREPDDNKHDVQKSTTFLAKLFKWKKLCIKDNGSRHISTSTEDKANSRGPNRNFSCSVACIPSNVSFRDVIITTYPPSPALSIPGRNKDISHDMEALRLSRQDDPFLKVLASRESLADSLSGELESEVANQVLSSEMDPLSVPEFHKHMVRSPPPVNWSRSPIFRFDNSSQESLGTRVSRNSHHYSRESVTELPSRLMSPVLNIPSYSQHRSSSAECKDRRSNRSGSFSLLTPASLRSLSDVRRLHTKSCEESQQLVKSA